MLWTSRLTDAGGAEGELVGAVADGELVGMFSADELRLEDCAVSKFVVELPIA